MSTVSDHRANEREEQTTNNQGAYVEYSSFETIPDKVNELAVIFHDLLDLEVMKFAPLTKCVCTKNQPDKFEFPQLEDALNREGRGWDCVCLDLLEKDVAPLDLTAFSDNDIEILQTKLQDIVEKANTIFRSSLYRFCVHPDLFSHHRLDNESYHRNHRGFHSEIEVRYTWDYETYRVDFQYRVDESKNEVVNYDIHTAIKWYMLFARMFRFEVLRHLHAIKCHLAKQPHFDIPITAMTAFNVGQADTSLFSLHHLRAGIENLADLGIPQFNAPDLQAPEWKWLAEFPNNLPDVDITWLSFLFYIAYIPWVSSIMEKSLQAAEEKMKNLGYLLHKSCLQAEDITSLVPAEKISDEDECPICGIEYSEDDPAVSTACDHIFGRTCLDSWVTYHTRNQTCPTCRAKLAGHLKYVPWDMRHSIKQFNSVKGKFPTKLEEIGKLLDEGHQDFYPKRMGSMLAHLHHLKCQQYHIWQNCMFEFYRSFQKQCFREGNWEFESQPDSDSDSDSDSVVYSDSDSEADPGDSDSDEEAVAREFHEDPDGEIQCASCVEYHKYESEI